MAKSLEEINSEYKGLISGLGKVPRTRYRKKNKKVNFLSSLLFYFALVFMLFSALAFATSNNVDKSIAGYRFFNVLTGSMQRVYPQGSFIVTKQTEIDTISVGDDITYYIDEATTRTHRVVEVVNDCDDEGSKGFWTQGVENGSRDSEVVHEKNVVGVVKLCIPKMGFILQMIARNVWLVGVVFVLVMILSFSLKILFGESEPKEKIA